MDGLILIDKPAGITSYGVVDRIKRKVKKTKVGHSGTLDPQATGLLLILIGRATKIVEYLYTLHKEYVAGAMIGIRTDTQDIWGKIESQESASSIKREDIEALIPRFCGKIKQIPPMVSALHHQGERLYKLAKRGIVVERKEREVTIHRLNLIDFKEGEHPEARFDIVCSGGTYIRTLFTDIGEALGKGATLNYLRRMRIGNFAIENAVSLEKFLEEVSAGKLESLILPIDNALSFLPEVVVDDPYRILHGQPFRYLGPVGLFRILSPEGVLLGVAKGENRIGRPVKVLADFDDL
ncbi:MAG: tRNA pseudouridine(55) synthase TruB [Candidatus Desantisbacteria bacterium]